MRMLTQSLPALPNAQRQKQAVFYSMLTFKPKLYQSYTTGILSMAHTWDSSLHVQKTVFMGRNQRQIEFEEHIPTQRPTCHIMTLNWTFPNFRRYKEFIGNTLGLLANNKCCTKLTGMDITVSDLRTSTKRMKENIKLQLSPLPFSMFYYT